MKWHAVCKINITARDTWIAIIFILFISLDMLEYLFTLAFQGLMLADILHDFFNVARFVLLISSFLLVVKKREKVLKLAIISCALLVLISCSFFVNSELAKMGWNIFSAYVGTYIPAIGIGMCICESTKILQYSVKFLPIVYLYVFCSILIEDISLVYQNVSYPIIFFAMGTLTVAFQEHKKGFFVHYIVLFMLIIYLGARGPLLCMMIWTAFLFLYMDRTKIIRGMAIFMLVFLTTLYWCFWNEFITELHRLIPGSRIIAQLYKGSFWESGRNSLYTICLKELGNRWLTFGGIMADRFYLVDTFHNTSQLGFWVEQGAYSSVYAHNIWLELCFCFGNIIGTGLLFVLIWRLVKVIIKYKKSEYFLLVCSLTLIGFVPLWFSNSYLASTYFWLMIGVLCTDYKKKTGEMLYEN